MVRLERQAFRENSFFTYLDGITARADTAISTAEVTSGVVYSIPPRQTSLDVPLTPPSTGIKSTALREDTLYKGPLHKDPTPRQDADLEIDSGIYPLADQDHDIDMDEWIDAEGGLHINDQQANIEMDRETNLHDEA